jgi:hypothetical protein
MKRLYYSCYLLVLWSLALSAAPNSNVQSLAGTWHFQLDPGNAGLKENWFETTLAGKIHLPGSTDEAKASPAMSSVKSGEALGQVLFLKAVLVFVPFRLYPSFETFSRR